MPSGRTLWILDGHNVIFALPRFCALQIEGDRAGARRELELALQRVEVRGEARVVVVYDGNALPRNPDAMESATLSICFSQPPEEADDRIVFLATQALSRGQDVTVVTNDRRSLASRLPAGARVMDVEAFWARHVEGSDTSRPSADDDGRPEGDFSDIERNFLSRSREIETNAARAGRRLERDRSRQWEARRGGRPCGDDDPVRRERGSGPQRPRAPSGRPHATRTSGSGPRPSTESRPDAKEPGARCGFLPGASSQSDPAAEARARRRARGERKQNRRLEWMRRGRVGKRKGKS